MLPRIFIKIEAKPTSRKYVNYHLLAPESSRPSNVLHNNILIQIIIFDRFCKSFGHDVFDTDPDQEKTNNLNQNVIPRQSKRSIVEIPLEMTSFNRRGRGYECGLTDFCQPQEVLCSEYLKNR